LGHALLAAGRTAAARLAGVVRLVGAVAFFVPVPRLPTVA
jgi:hypothetical protein